MTNEEWVKVGLISAKELNVPIDARVEVSFVDYDYQAARVVKEEYIYTTYEYDVISPQLWRDGDFLVGLGYSKKLNILVVWPPELFKERLAYYKWIERDRAKA